MPIVTALNEIDVAASTIENQDGGDRVVERYSTQEDVVACELDDSFAILKLETSEYFKLNATGALVWERISSGATLDEIVEAVSSNFDIGPEECRHDVIALVAELEKAGLIVRVA